jgi:hypothetical protein
MNVRASKPKSDSRIHGLRQAPVVTFVLLAGGTSAHSPTTCRRITCTTLPSFVLVRVAPECQHPPSCQLLQHTVCDAQQVVGLLKDLQTAAQLGIACDVYSTCLWLAQTTRWEALACAAARFIV